MTTSQNKHAEEAATLLTDKPGEYEPGEYEIEKARSLATLAVAYEARTANMLELYKASRLWDSAVLHAEFGYAIKARLDAEQ